MKNMESLIRRAFFYGAFVVAVVAVIEKIANLTRHSLFRGIPEPSRLLEYAAIGLLFAIAMQLHQIRLLLGGKPDVKTK